MNYNQVKTKKVVNDNKMMQYSTPNLDVYQGLQCPLSCQVEEDVDHIAVSTDMFFDTQPTLT